MIRTDAVTAIVGLCGMFDDTGVPDVGSTQILDFAQRLGCEVRQLAAAVLFHSTVLLATGIVIPEQAGKNLIDNYFFVRTHTIISDVMENKSPLLKGGKGGCQFT